jgi:hypothetical protein
MRVRRDVSAIPLRSASETWEAIVDLVSGSGSKDVGQLVDAGGVMGSIITDEHPANSAIILEGVGAQLRIYCRYGMKAIEEGEQLDALTWNPTAGDWTMHVPCDAENIAWVRASLSRTSERIKVFDVAEGDWDAEDDSAKLAANGSKEIVVDWSPKG